MVASGAPLRPMRAMPGTSPRDARSVACNFGHVEGAAQRARGTRVAGREWRVGGCHRQFTAGPSCMRAGKPESLIAWLKHDSHGLDRLPSFA